MTDRQAGDPDPGARDEGTTTLGRWQTHQVSNQVDERVDYDLYATDAALGEALERAAADADRATLAEQGRQLGRAECFALAARANAHEPELDMFDARGRRVDHVAFSGAWHALLAGLRADGAVTLPFEDRRPGRWSAWAACFYLHGQVEAGTLCPATMTQASIPVLRREPTLWPALASRLLHRGHDPSDRPIEQKQSIWVGMGMTEKQGGSDVRANATTAVADGDGGRGATYRLRGHKWFFSAPQSDAHLVVARCAEAGLSCFFVPRRLPDGALNGVRIQRLKDKLGNRSNASSEVEFQDAAGVLIGEPGRGIPTIIEMATYTRLNCVVGSAALMRQALVQAISYARGRHAFGRPLVGQPLMATVLADLALDSEAALTLAMRLAAAYEDDEDSQDRQHNQHPEDSQHGKEGQHRKEGQDREEGQGRGVGRAGPSNPPGRALLERGWKRIMTPAAKAWVCKRAIAFTGETMEVLGGNGYIDTGIMARLFREAPVNSIWEGSGNVMCLDVLRAIEREPAAWRALLDDLAGDGADDRRLMACHADLVAAVGSGAGDGGKGGEGGKGGAGREGLKGDAGAIATASARAIVERLVLLAQAVLLRRQAPAVVAEAFAAARLGRDRALQFGAAPLAARDAARLIDRAFPA